VSNNALESGVTTTQENFDMDMHSLETPTEQEMPVILIHSNSEEHISDTNDSFSPPNVSSMQTNESNREETNSPRSIPELSRNLNLIQPENPTVTNNMIRYITSWFGVFQNKIENSPSHNEEEKEEEEEENNNFDLIF